jgi:hypothetical protein
MWEGAVRGGALTLFSVNRKTIRRASLALAAALALAACAVAQTWTGAANNSWNNAANWTNPSVVPNSATADVLFGPSGNSSVAVQGTFAVQSLTFDSPTNNYSLFNPFAFLPGQIWSLQTITVADTVTTTQLINFASPATGGLVFTAALGIANNALPTLVANPTLHIGTSFGTPAINSAIRVTGTGTTLFTGTFSGVNRVQNGLGKFGPGILTLFGDGTNLFGGLALAGGTLRLDYSTNTASKLGGGGLTSDGGDLVVVPHASTAITQNFDFTALTAGHTEFVLNQSNFTIGLGAITRSAGATLNFSPTGSAILFALSPTATNTNGLLGTGSAFATALGQFWLTKSASSSNINPLSSGQSNVFGPASNTDITTSYAAPAPLTNSLRFTANATLTLQGAFTVQSGGILLPATVSSGTITGAGTLRSGQNELLAHVYGDMLTIDSSIVVTNGLTKTGRGTLTLGGNNFFLDGQVNVNRGHLRATHPFAIDSLEAINFNDARTGPGLQRFTVEVGNNINAQTSASIRLSAYSVPGNAEANVFTTGTSLNSRVTLNGVISSAAGAVTPLQFSGSGIDTSGFNLIGENTFTGTVRLDDGTLGINSNFSLGNPANALILDTFSTTNGGLEFLNGGIDVARPVFINSATRVVSNGVDVNTISGPVTGGTLFKAGTGTLVLTSAGNDGERDVRGGTLRVAAGALGTNGALILGHGATLAVSGNNSLAAARTIVLGSVPGPATATIDVAANQTFTVAGPVVSNAGSSSTLVKTGAGTLALTNGGPMNFSGQTLELNGGLLVNNGRVSGTTNVNFGSVAKGAGTFGVVNVNQGGVYAPGNSAGVSNAASVRFANTPIVGGPTLMIELAGTTPGTGFDQLRVTGPLALGGTLAVSLIEGFTPVAGSSFDILDWGTLSGTFSTLALPTLSGLAWNTSQLYTTGVLSLAAAGLRGDFNLDGTINALDIDRLALAAHNEPSNLFFDLNSDGRVTFTVSPPGAPNTSDSDVLIREILQTRYGDADLNGQVFLSDLTKLATNYRQPGQFGWAQGNFNGSQEAGTSATPRVFLSDLTALATNWRFGVGSGAAIAAIPEPSSLSLVFCLAVCYSLFQSASLAK